MKNITLPLMFFVVLTGCVGAETSENYVDKTRMELEQKYAEITSGEKTMKKAFQAYEMFLSGGYNEIIRSGYDSHKKDCWCLDSYIDRSQDFRYRFCNIDDTIDSDNIKNILIVKIFDKDNSLSDKDRYCMESICDSKGHGGWFPKSYVHNEDECIIIRRHLLNDIDLDKQCVFNYKHYIPKYAKIGSHTNFNDLYKAYHESLEQCKEKRDSIEITTAEYNDCIDSVDERFEKIVKSGILK